VRTPRFPKIAPLSSGIAVFSGKYTFTRGLGGFGGSGGGPWGEGWGHMGEGSAALGTLVSAAPLIRAKLYFVDRHGVW
jgi:hypothetical protein